MTTASSGNAVSRLSDLAIVRKLRNENRAADQGDERESDISRNCAGPSIRNPAYRRLRESDRFPEAGGRVAARKQGLRDQLEVDTLKHRLTMIHERIASASTHLIGLQNASMHSPGDQSPVRALIEKLRQAKGFASARALATAAGIPQPTLARYLNGTSETMEVVNFQALARVLDVTLSELLGEVPITERKDVRELEQIMAHLREPEKKAWIAAGRAMMVEHPGDKPRPS